jgi:putative phosphoribosyl transferase
MSVSRGYYLDRHEAGRVLAEHLKHWKGQPDLLVLGIPRGGVVVAAEVAEALGAPLDILPARKIGAPGNPEFALGAVAEDMVYIDERLIESLGISRSYVEGEALRQQALSRLQGQRLRGGLPPLPIEGRTVILVDDGVATGATVQAALLALQTKAPRRRILAVPVAPPAAVERLRAAADEVVCPLMPEEFWAVGQFYEDFRQVSDEEVIRLIQRRRGAGQGAAQ